MNLFLICPFLYKNNYIFCYISIYFVSPHNFITISFLKKYKLLFHLTWLTSFWVFMSYCAWFADVDCYKIID